MTPSLFDLPLRLGDVAALAGLLLNQPPKPLTDEFRARIASRASALAFDSMTPLYSTLERDPVHPAALYIAVDGVDKQPLLLRLAPASTPSSGLFPKAILIGRTFVGNQEVVLNAIPFGPADHEQILTFSEKVSPSFQPKPFGSRPVIRVSGDSPATKFPLAFEAFRRMLRSSGRITAAFGIGPDQDPAAFYFATVWSAIRAGWREGYTLHSPVPVPAIPGVRRRPFETELNITREVALRAGMTTDEISAAL